VSSVGIVLPAFREEATIVEAIERLINVMSNHHFDYQIILVVDGEVDETAERARAIESERVIVHSYRINRGKGYALLQGLNLVSAPLTVFFDGDLDLDPNCIPSMLENIENGFADVVVGSKIHKNSIVDYPLKRKVQSKVMRTIVRCLFGLSISDTQTGAKAFRTEALRDCAKLVKSEGFAFDVDLLVRLNSNNQRIMEHPVRIDYQFNTSTRIKDVFLVLRDLLRIRKNWKTDMHGQLK
jgi:glycosyltransferase involved in cell wall biosynthesis